MSNQYKPAKELNQIYDDWYDLDQPHWESAPGKDVLISALRTCCPIDRKLLLLDIGCGTGSFLQRIHNVISKMWELYGIDFSNSAISIAKKLLDYCNFTCSDATTINYPNSIIDVVTCYGSWEHFKKPKEAITEAVRVLKPGGMVFSMIPTLARIFHQ